MLTISFPTYPPAGCSVKAKIWKLTLTLYIVDWRMVVAEGVNLRGDMSGSPYMCQQAGRQQDIPTSRAIQCTLRRFCSRCCCWRHGLLYNSTYYIGVHAGDKAKRVGHVVLYNSRTTWGRPFHGSEHDRKQACNVCTALTGLSVITLQMKSGLWSEVRHPSTRAVHSQRIRGGP